MIWLSLAFGLCAFVVGVILGQVMSAMVMSKAASELTDRMIRACINFVPDGDKPRALVAMREAMKGKS